MASLRIRGLVRAMNDVRQQLAAGIPESEAEEFRNRVRGLVAEVEGLCRAHQISPDQLPQPSWRAYQYLKTLDLQALPIVAQRAPLPPKPLRIRNLVALCNGLHAELDRLSRLALTKPRSPARPERAALLRQVQAHVEAVEKLAAEAGASPSALPTRSRRAYQWLKFLSDPANLELHLHTLRAALEILQQHRPHPPAAPLPAGKFRVELYHTSYLYRAQPGPERTRIVLNEGFAGAPREVLRAVILMATGAGAEAQADIVQRYASSDDFAEMVQALEVAGSEAAPTTQGRHHNLEEVFARVNARYFGRALDRPRLTWNQTLSQRKFGHYQPSSDTVMVSITLDDPGVPAHVIDFVMYHELLHKELGVQIVRGRRLAHTRAFRAKEKRFPRHKEARDYLKQLSGE